MFASETARDYRIEFTDHYDLEGIIPPLPPYEGSPTGPGPLINATPSDRLATSSLVGTRRGEIVSTLKQNFDLDLATVSDGVVIEMNGERISGFASAGLSLNIADWSASTDERVTIHTGRRAREIKRWHDSASDTEFKFGVYLETGLALKLKEHLSLTAFGRYDWTDSIEASFGASRVDIDLSGWSAGASLRFTF